MDEVRPERLLKEEEEFVAATYELAHLIAGANQEVMDMQWQIAKYPGDQITYRRYYKKKAELIREFTKSLVFIEDDGEQEYEGGSDDDGGPTGA